MVLLGKQAIDDDSGTTPQILASLLNWNQGVFCSKLEIQDDKATVVREVKLFALKSI